MYTKCKAIAHVVKTHGRRGEVVAVSACDLSSVIEKGSEVCIVPPALKGKRWRRIRAISEGVAGYLISFEDIDGIDAASKIVGKTLLVKQSDLDDEFFLNDPDSLISRAVADIELGMIGHIEEVMVGPANDVWVIRGKYGEVLLPVIDDVIKSYSDLDKPIVVEVPGGLSENIDKARMDL